MNLITLKNTEREILSKHISSFQLGKKNPVNYTPRKWAFAG
jgi:hypothetical protein